VRSLQHLCQLGHDLELSFVDAGEHDRLEVVNGDVALQSIIAYEPAGA
jgi:hypothetical protein